MERYSREDVITLLEEVIKMRQNQPKVLDEVFRHVTLSLLKQHEFDEFTKTVNIPESLSILPQLSLQNQPDHGERIRDKIIEQVQILHILRKKKNCRISKVLDELQDAT